MEVLHLKGLGWLSFSGISTQSAQRDGRRDKLALMLPPEAWSGMKMPSGTRAQSWTKIIT